MHFRRTGAVVRLAILTAVLTWFAQTVAEAADAVTLRTPIKGHRFQPTDLKAQHSGVGPTLHLNVLNAGCEACSSGRRYGLFRGWALRPLETRLNARGTSEDACF